jgi:hypothetical protein
MFVADLFVLYLQASYGADAEDTIVLMELMQINREVYQSKYDHLFLSEMGDFLNPVALAEEQALREAFPCDRLQWLARQWPAQRRCWLPTAGLSPADAAMVEKMAVAKKRDLHWQLTAAKCADPALRSRYLLTATGFQKQWDHLFLLAERVLARRGCSNTSNCILSSEDIMVSAGAALTQADELACTAMEQGNKEAVELCGSAAVVLRSLLDGRNLFRDACLAQKAVETALACADCYIRASNALLGGSCRRYVEDDG